MRRLEHVLDEYDGPTAISMLSRSHERFFAVASDSEMNGQVVRWIEVEIDDAEWRSLLDGDLGLRDFFQKPLVRVVDRAPDLSVLQEWEVAGSDLSDVDLPSEGASFGGFDFSDLLRRLELMEKAKGTRVAAQRAVNRIVMQSRGVRRAKKSNAPRGPDDATRRMFARKSRRRHVAEEPNAA